MRLDHFFPVPFRYSKTWVKQEQREERARKAAIIMTNETDPGLVIGLKKTGLWVNLERMMLSERSWSQTTDCTTPFI
jgi:hypothetical protein